jgi:hypothetical protein
MNYKTCLNGMGALLQAFPDRKFDNAAIFNFVKDLTNEQFYKAIKKIVSTKTELYPGTNIIALILEYAVADDSVGAGEAWGRVRNAMSDIGSYGMPNFNYELIDETVRILGWRNLCMSENEIADRAHFMKIYDNIVIRNKNTKMLLDNDPFKLIAGNAK